MVYKDGQQPHWRNSWVLMQFLCFYVRNMASVYVCSLYSSSTFETLYAESGEIVHTWRMVCTVIKLEHYSRTVLHHKSICHSLRIKGRHQMYFSVFLEYQWFCFLGFGIITENALKIQHKITFIYYYQPFASHFASIKYLFF